jgi:adenine-specific DNA-methyltransferase
VQRAGRAWYEIWVPQQPDGWAAPKLVWPDISERPRFFLDTSGAIVNGDCYWLSCAGRADDEVALALAVANSTFAVQFYDLRCGNRLYSGRRRFITQYLEDLPIPQTSSGELREVAELVAKLRSHDAASSAEPITALESALDSMVSELFGLKEVDR